MKNIILLGSTGFVGSFLLNKLKNENFELKAMIHEKTTNVDVETFNGDILLPGTLDKKLKDGDIVINLIGQTGGKISDLIDLNIEGGMNFLNSCIGKKLDKIILISSINVYGENMESPSKEDDPLRPQTSYGLIKLLTEKMYQMYSEMYGINVIILRLSNLYGYDKKSGFIADLINSVNGPGKTLGIYNNGMQLRDLLFIEDAVDGIIHTIKFAKGGFNIFNITSGQRYMIKELINMVEEISGKKINVELISDALDEKCIWADNSKAKKILQFVPKIPIQEGLKLTINHLMNE